MRHRARGSNLPKLGGLVLGALAFGGALTEVDWTIALSPNERDGLWARFEGLVE